MRHPFGVRVLRALLQPKRSSHTYPPALVETISLHFRWVVLLTRWLVTHHGVSSRAASLEILGRTEEVKSARKPKVSGYSEAETKQITIASEFRLFTEPNKIMKAIIWRLSGRFWAIMVGLGEIDQSGAS